MAPSVWAIATCCSSPMSSPRKNTTPRCSNVDRMLPASRPRSKVSRSVLISLPILGSRSRTSSCAEVSPMMSAHSRENGSGRMLYARLLPQLDRKRDGNQRVQQVAQVGDIVGKWFGVVELVDVGDGLLGVRKQLVVERLDLVHRAVHPLHIALMTVLDGPLRNEAFEL